MGVAKAVSNPTQWVLKPQREGGGNNLYNEDLARTLERGPPDGLAQYVLMERMVSEPMEAFMRKPADAKDAICATKVRSTGEIGIFATCCMNGSDEVINTVGGAFLRTKEATSNEGGVCAGFGALDTPLLVS